MKIVFAHLLNDYSGSPLILSSIIKAAKEKGYEVDLFTSGNNEGFLSDLGVNYYYFPYRFFVNKYIRLMVFMSSQMILFFKMLWRYRNQKDVAFYVNTLLPFGAGLAGRILGKRVVYHVHETSMKPPIFKKLLKNFANKTADSAIYVSNNLMKMEALPNVEGKVVYNGLSKDFIIKAQVGKNDTDAVFRVLMLCSLKDYKGVPEFVELAKRLPNYEFELVVNATENEIKNYFGTIPNDKNLIIFPVQSNVHPFYQRANLVLNLSHPQTWVETFGMTILEAMHYGIPCIVPPIGGPVELIDNGVQGFLIDQRNLDIVIEKINLIATDKILYQSFSDAALQKAQTFSVENMIEGCISTIIKEQLE
jgi:glycosyltransferase involved in cell wall biosynthesis